MEFHISKESQVTIHDQLTEELTFAIATGQLKPGDALPSVRQLARRLKIHHNTVSQVYQELVNRDLIVRRPGSHMVVRSPGESENPPGVEDLDDLINATVQAARERGYTTQQLRRRVEERLMAQAPDHILVVSDYPGMRHLFRKELGDQLPYSVETCSPEDVSLKPDLLIGALVTAPPGEIPQFASLLPKDRPAIPIEFSQADEELERVRRLRDPSVIAIVSISEFFLRTARGVLAPAVGQRHTTREYLLPRESVTDLGAADLVVCDSIARRRVRAPNLIHYRLVSAACLKQISSAMTS